MAKVRVAGFSISRARQCDQPTTLAVRKLHITGNYRATDDRLASAPFAFVA
jgi:hypothetical protein